MLEGQAISPAISKFEFRGRFLDCFALLEDHLAAALVRLVERGHCKKAPYLFGDKFELVRTTAAAQGIWQNPQHVTPILESLERFAKIRGLICHGVIEETSLGNEPALSIRGPGQTDFECRRVLTMKECNSTLDELANLTVKLTRQLLKSSSSEGIA